MVNTAGFVYLKRLGVAAITGSLKIDLTLLPSMLQEYSRLTTPRSRNSRRLRLRVRGLLRTYGLFTENLVLARRERYLHSRDQCISLISTGVQVFLKGKMANSRKG